VHIFYQHRRYDPSQNWPRVVIVTSADDPRIARFSTDISFDDYFLVVIGVTLSTSGDNIAVSAITDTGGEIFIELLSWAGYVDIITIRLPLDVVVQMPIGFLDREFCARFAPLHTIASNIDTGRHFYFFGEWDINHPLVDGIVMLPLRVLTNAMGAEIERDAEPYICVAEHPAAHPPSIRT